VTGTAAERAAAWEPDEEDRAFLDVYGPWDPLTPTQVSELMADYPAPWWIVGGHAIEAFTGVRRMHEDVDLVIFARDVPAFRTQVGESFHLWSNFGGTFRLIDDKHPDPLDPNSQIWVRRNARSPWVLDCILNPDVAGRWQSRREADHVADLDEVTWVAGDGIHYLNPEITLFFKAARHRVKDEIDLDNAWPLLSDQQRAWLRDAVRRYDREHPWNERLAGV
jgi:hypothetical protein